MIKSSKVLFAAFCFNLIALVIFLLSLSGKGTAAKNNAYKQMCENGNEASNMTGEWWLNSNKKC
jgi:hypothetical protein